MCILAATNLPWELDMALLRRLEKRILVPLPTAAARATIMSSVLPRGGTNLRADARLDYDALAARTDGYSGSDLTLVCKEAAMRPLRRLLSKLDLDPAAARASNPSQLAPEPVSEDDFLAALETTKSTVQAYGAKYAEWAAEFGSV